MLSIQGRIIHDLSHLTGAALQEEFQLLNGHGPKQLTSPEKHINGIVAPDSQHDTLPQNPDQDRCLLLLES